MKTDLDMTRYERVMTALARGVPDAVDFLYGTPDAVDQATLACLGAAKHAGLLLGADCGLPRDTPPENVRAMVGAAKREGAYYR
ncbi:MAG: uroporphyrinogen decarboxylase family protein [Chloroflexi bacterium]|nr:uroporphyrinogen decarboxylase family protein [Chloroflexota bacterium]